MIGVDEVRSAAVDLGLGGSPVCVHSSFRAFGGVEGGPDAVIDGFLAAGCTVLVPAFTYQYMVDAPPGPVPERNAWTAGVPRTPPPMTPYDQSTVEVHRDMGAIPAAVCVRPDRARGRHPVCSFAAVGPLAEDLIGGQAPHDKMAPLAALAAAGGSVVLMGVGLQRMTLLHHAEQLAGRAMFRRWAQDADGSTIPVEMGGCSEGFGALEAALAHLERAAVVGRSTWRVFPAAATAAAAAAAILTDPAITRCPDPDCGRCEAAMAGGPVLDA